MEDTIISEKLFQRETIDYSNSKNPDQLKYWLGFSKVYSIGTIHFEKMISYFHSIEEAWTAPSSELINIEGFTPNVISKFINERNSISDLNSLVEKISKDNIQVITLADDNYPVYLREIYDPPIVLYIKGDLSRLNQDRSLAVVGSRKASHYIKEVLRKIISELRGHDLSIVSGMAVGVDSSAHQAALDNDINTIAVIGSGFDNIYPEKNKKLFKDIIISGGAIVSEYFPTERAALWTFPRRNRIISGLAQGTLVGEAGLKSGALITARLCLEQNRELMCIPGNITNPNTEGSFKLIKEGAAVVTEAKDVFHHLNWEFSTENLKIKSEKSLNISPQEQKIYSLLDLEPKMFDYLLDNSKLEIGELMMVLTSLELMGLIKQLPGQQFVKNL